MEIYFKPHSSRIQEQLFFNSIKKSITEANHIKENFSLPKSLISELLKRDEIIALIECDSLLPKKKKNICLDEMKKLPKELRIAESIAKINVDYVITNGNENFYIEFHEKQHRYLSVNRPTPIFSNDLVEYRIPRFVQRFLRDIWRWKYLDNYKIIWFDWFEANPITKIDFTSNGKMELGLAGKFSFEKFLK